MAEKGIEFKLNIKIGHLCIKDKTIKFINKTECEYERELSEKTNCSSEIKSYKNPKQFFNSVIFPNNFRTSNIT